MGSFFLPPWGWESSKALTPWLVERKVVSRAGKNNKTAKGREGWVEGGVLQRRMSEGTFLKK